MVETFKVFKSDRSIPKQAEILEKFKYMPTFYERLYEIGELISESREVNNTSADFYTVPTGKVLFIIFISLNNKTTAGNPTGHITLSVNGIGNPLLFLYAPVSATEQERHKELLFPYPFKLNETDFLRVESLDVKSYAYAHFYGFLINRTDLPLLY